jgi:hypothetical protein
MACYLHVDVHACHPDLLQKFFMAGPWHQSFGVLAHMVIWLMAIHDSHVLDESAHQYTARLVHSHFQSFPILFFQKSGL